MKLYFSPGACSLAPHIVARELGLDIETEKVDIRAKMTASGEDFLGINPKGYVPVLRLDDGALLTEGPVISQYLADQNPTAGLVPENGTMARYRLQELLNYISTELHKTYSPLFNPATTEDTKTERREYLKRRYALLDEVLADKPFLTGEQFTVADAYLFTVTNWARHTKVDLSELANLAAFQERVAARPAVRDAMKHEGLLKE